RRLAPCRRWSADPRENPFLPPAADPLEKLVQDGNARPRRGQFCEPPPGDLRDAGVGPFGETLVDLARPAGEALLEVQLGERERQASVRSRDRGGRRRP